ncbi:hypothetical protein Micbo1qcDRAFT_53390, partial [Microdochium bolleyi]
ASQLVTPFFVQVQTTTLLTKSPPQKYSRVRGGEGVSSLQIYSGHTDRTGNTKHHRLPAIHPPALPVGDYSKSPPAPPLPPSTLLLLLSSCSPRARHHRSPACSQNTDSIVPSTPTSTRTTARVVRVRPSPSREKLPRDGLPSPLPLPSRRDLGARCDVRARRLVTRVLLLHGDGDDRVGANRGRRGMNVAGVGDADDDDGDDEAIRRMAGVDCAPACAGREVAISSSSCRAAERSNCAIFLSFFLFSFVMCPCSLSVVLVCEEETVVVVVPCIWCSLRESNARYADKGTQEDTPGAVLM